MEKKSVSLAQLIPLIEEELAADGEFEININGTSMLPLLVEGRDTVTLARADGPLKKNDVPLYKRADGSYVLHRVISVSGGKYTMCGDNQWIKEAGIVDSQIIAKAVRFQRKGKIVEADSFGYRLYCRLWGFLFPVRKYIVKLRGKLSK